MKSSLKNMVLVLFTITAVSALLVALVNTLTKDTIARTEQKNKDIAKLEVLPSFEGEPLMEEQTKQIGNFSVTVTKVSAEGELVGYAVEAPSITKNGYADRIYLMVGFVENDGATTINGIRVISQKETPGLGANMIKAGNKLETSAVGKNPDEMVFMVTKDDAEGSFDSLTGSTISSRAYANAVETAYAAYLWAKGELDTSKDAIADAPTGATTPDGESGATLTDADAPTGATTTTEAAAMADDATNKPEPEAQKGEISNE